MALKEAGIEHREDSNEEGIRAWVPDNERNRWAYSQVEDLVRCYELTLEAAKLENVKITPYKPLQRHVALIAALRAQETAEDDDLRTRLGNLLHEFVWAQPLPNANHRSAFLLVARKATQQNLELVSDEDMIVIGNEFAKKSKPLISEKEFRPDPTREKRQHRQAAKEAVARLVEPNQS